MKLEKYKHLVNSRYVWVINEERKNEVTNYCMNEKNGKNRKKKIRNEIIRVIASANKTHLQMLIITT